MLRISDLSLKCHEPYLSVAHWQAKLFLDNKEGGALAIIIGEMFKFKSEQGWCETETYYCVFIFPQASSGVFFWSKVAASPRNDHGDLPHAH